MDTIADSEKNLFGNSLHKCLVVIGWSIFVIYALFLIMELFLGNYRSHGDVRCANLIPFLTISHYIVNRDHFSANILIINLVGNICVFIPMGFLLPCLFRGMRNFLRILLFGIVLIFIVESLQWLLCVGIFDVDDIILNVMGIIIGYSLFKLINTFLKMISSRAHST